MPADDVVDGIVKNLAVRREVTNEFGKRGRVNDPSAFNQEFAVQWRALCDTHAEKDTRHSRGG